MAKKPKPEKTEWESELQVVMRGSGNQGNMHVACDVPHKSLTGKECMRFLVNSQHDTEIEADALAADDAPGQGKLVETCDEVIRCKTTINQFVTDDQHYRFSMSLTNSGLDDATKGRLVSMKKTAGKVRFKKLGEAPKRGRPKSVDGDDLEDEIDDDQEE